MHLFYFRLGIGLASLGLVQAASASPYAILGLGNFGVGSAGQSSSTALAVNNAGQVLGSSSVYDSNNIAKGSAAFLSSGGPLQNLGNFGTDKNGRGTSLGTALNSSGAAVGSSTVYDVNGINKGSAAFLYTNGSLQNLGNFGTSLTGSGSSTAADINDSGAAVGSSTVYDSSGVNKGSAAFLYSGGTLQNLGNFGTDNSGFGSSAAKALNNSGQVVGSSTVYDVNGINKGSAAFLYSGGTLQNLGNFGTDNSGKGSSFAVGINDSGMVIGDSDVYVNGVYTTTDAFLYANGQMSDLGSFGTDINQHGSSIPVAVNAVGQVAGASDKYDALGNSLGRDAFLYTNGALNDLGNFGTDSGGKGFSVATGLNASGQVVGTSKVYDSAHNPLGTDSFLYDHGTLTDLNSLITNGAGWTNIQAAAINDSGEIVGFGTFNGQTQAFAMMPVPEASTTVTFGLLLALGMGAAVRARQKKA